MIKSFSNLKKVAQEEKSTLSEFIDYLDETLIGIKTNFNMGRKETVIELIGEVRNEVDRFLKHPEVKK